MRPAFRLFLTLFVAISLIMIGCSSDDEGNGNNMLATMDDDGILDPDDTIEIGSPSSVEVFDIGNESNSGDIRIFFRAGANHLRVGEYRVIISKAGSVLDLNASQQIPSANYYSVQNVTQNPRFNLDNGINDIDGDPIINKIEYTVFVLALPDSQHIEPQLSEGSPIFQLADKELKDIYISSRSTNSVELFDGVTGEHLESFVASGAGGLSAPQEVIFREDGSLIVTGRFNSAIKQYNGTTGTYLGDFTSGYTLDNPTKTTYGPDGNLYVSQWGNTQNSIVRFDGETGVFIDEVVDSYFQGMGHAWDSAGNFYTVSYGLKQLRKYDDQFGLEFSIGSPLTGPVNVWIDSTNILHVVDWEDGTVKRFDSSGRFLDIFISGLVKVEGFLFDGKQILLCDWQANRVNVYDSQTGTYLRTHINSNQIQQPNSITFGPDKRP